MPSRLFQRHERKRPSHRAPFPLAAGQGDDGRVAVLRRETVPLVLHGVVEGGRVAGVAARPSAWRRPSSSGSWGLTAPPGGARAQAWPPIVPPDPRRQARRRMRPPRACRLRLQGSRLGPSVRGAIVFYQALVNSSLPTLSSVGRALNLRAGRLSFEKPSGEGLRYTDQPLPSGHRHTDRPRTPPRGSRILRRGPGVR
jgi:hypothetical protein